VSKPVDSGHAINRQLTLTARSRRVRQIVQQKV